MAESPLGIGIIGAGQIVKRHALAYRALPELARLVAVADLDRKRAEAARQRYRFERAFGDAADLFDCEEIDAVSICTPAGLHERMVIEAIRAGKHVLCEKPIAVSLAEADRVVAAAEQHGGQTVSCVFQLRFDAAHRRIRWLIEQGHLGRVLSARVCVRLRKTPGYYTSGPGRGSYKSDGGGVLINQAIHQVDALLWFLGKPVQVSAAMDTFVHPIEAEDTLTGWVRFKGGAIAAIECTTCAKKKEFSIDIIGERASVRISGDPDSQRFDWRTDAAGSVARKAVKAMALRAVPEPREPNKFLEGLQKAAAKLSRRDRPLPLHKGHTPLIRAFLEAARRGATGPIPPHDARRSIELVTACYESALTSRSVQFPVSQDSPFYAGFAAERVLIERHENKAGVARSEATARVESGHNTGEFGRSERPEAVENR